LAVLVLVEGFLCGQFGNLGWFLTRRGERELNY
jgi:hypothetical protein